jgi:butyryl-CoA dehydrogenase
MNFNLSEDHLMIQDMYREFVEKEIKPVAKEIDQNEEFPEGHIEKLAEMGFFGVPVPEEYNGQGADYLSYAIAVEELSKACAATGVLVSAHTSLGMMPIHDFGTDEQKQKYLPDLASGAKIAAFGLTEPGAGTDAGGVATIAVDKGDHYVLNGTKLFITNGGLAETFVIIASTDKSLGNKGLTAFIVEKSFPGFSVGREEEKMGIRGSSTTELIMEDCIVPKENRMGKEGEGFKIAMQILDGGRIGIAAQALGIAEGALAECMSYVTQRVQFGKRLSQFQNTQFEIAEMYTKVEATKLLVYRAAVAKSNHEKYSHLSAMAKLTASETASDVTRRVVQLFGGYGYTREYPVERMMRDAKITEIYEGTSEVQKMVIASYLGMR